MSLEALVWALKEAPTQSHAETLVLLVLADRAGGDGGFKDACPSQKTIGEITQMSSSSVKRHVRALESRGLIVRGNQRVTSGFREDRRPVVWNLNRSMKRSSDTSRGVTAMSPRSRMSPGSNRASRGVTAMTYEPSLIEPSLKGASDAPKRNDYPSDFEEFWKHYPSRGKHPNPKKSAFSKWKTAIKTTDADTLITAVKAYASSGLPEDRQMIPQAATWLSQERWEQQDTTSDTDWLRDCWQTGNTAAVTRRTGFNYGGVVWPDDIPDDQEERALIRLRQARAWIEENHDRILERLTSAA